MIRAAIIGAGAAGLCCARHLAKHTDKFSTILKVYEQMGEMGGTWTVQEKTKALGYPYTPACTGT